MLALVLHSTETRTPRHKVRAKARRLVGSNLVTLRFEIDGSRFVMWPEDQTSVPPVRRDELWKQTCLECFVGGSEHLQATTYCEWNFSPNGDWAAYTFERYRDGMAKPNVVAPSIEQIFVGEKARFEIDIALSDESAIGVPLLGLTAVIVEKDDPVPFYWALAHTGDKPDFHLRESFTLELES
jgi:hypothetical protein